MTFNFFITDGFRKRAGKIANKYRSIKTDLEKLTDSLEKDILYRSNTWVKAVTKYEWQSLQKEKENPGDHE